MLGVVLRNIRWGLSWSLSLAAIWCAYVCVLSVVRGSTRFDAYGTTLWMIVAVYIVNGVMGGIILGALRPIATSRLGAILVGVAVAIPFFIAVWFATDGPFSHWRSNSIEAILFCSISLGGILGNWFWMRGRKKSATADH